MRRRHRAIELRCYPRDDPVFAAEAARALAEHRASTSSERLLADVQRRLRDRFPDAHIQARDALADGDPDEAEVWYCYRDGRLVC